MSAPSSAPANSPSPLAKTRLCKWHLAGRCTYGTTCSWAHSKQELNTEPVAPPPPGSRPAVPSDASPSAPLEPAAKQAPPKAPNSHHHHHHRSAQPLAAYLFPEKLKTKPCRFFHATGRCLAGDHCRFAHGDVELRPDLPPEQAPNADQKPPADPPKTQPVAKQPADGKAPLCVSKAAPAPPHGLADRVASVSEVASTHDDSLDSPPTPTHISTCTPTYAPSPATPPPLSYHPDPFLAVASLTPPSRPVPLPAAPTLPTIITTAPPGFSAPLAPRPPQHLHGWAGQDVRPPAYTPTQAEVAGDGGAGEWVCGILFEAPPAYDCDPSLYDRYVAKRAPPAYSAHTHAHTYTQAHTSARARYYSLPNQFGY